MANERLGKKLEIGQVFETPSRRMMKNTGYAGYHGERPVQLKVRKAGDRDFFIKGKRRYFCEVKGISETRTGVYCWAYAATQQSSPGPRWWQFIYVVQIIEN